MASGSVDPPQGWVLAGGALTLPPMPAPTPPPLPIFTDGHCPMGAGAGVGAGVAVGVAVPDAATVVNKDAGTVESVVVKTAGIVIMGDKVGVL